MATTERFSKRQRYHLGTLGVVVLTIVVLFTEVWDRADHLIRLSAVVLEQESINLDPDSLKLRVENLKRERVAILRGWNSLGEGEPLPNSVSTVYAYLERAALRHSFEILSIEPLSAAETASEVQDIQIRVQGRARYHECGRLLWELERGNASVRVEKLSLKRREGLERGQEATVEIDFEARASIVRGG